MLRGVGGGWRKGMGILAAGPDVSSPGVGAKRIKDKKMSVRE